MSTSSQRGYPVNYGVISAPKGCWMSGYRFKRDLCDDSGPKLAHRTGSDHPHGRLIPASWTYLTSLPTEVSAAFGRPGVAEDLLCLLPGVLVEFQRFGAHLGQALRAQLDDVHQSFLLLLTAGVVGLRCDMADSRTVVLELAVVLKDDQRFEAPERNTSAIRHLGDLAANGLPGVVRLHVLHALFRVSHHPDTCLGFVLAGQPGIDGVHELAAFVNLGVRAQVPDIAELVLGKVVERGFTDLTSVDVLVQNKNRADAIHDLCDVGDRDA